MGVERAAGRVEGRGSMAETVGKGVAKKRRKPPPAASRPPTFSSVKEGELRYRNIAIDTMCCAIRRLSKGDTIDSIDACEEWDVDMKDLVQRAQTIDRGGRSVATYLKDVALPRLLDDHKTTIEKYKTEMAEWKQRCAQGRCKHAWCALRRKEEEKQPKLGGAEV